MHRYIPPAPPPKRIITFPRTVEPVNLVRRKIKAAAALLDLSACERRLHTCAYDTDNVLACVCVFAPACLDHLSEQRVKTERMQRRAYAPWHTLHSRSAVLCNGVFSAKTGSLKGGSADFTHQGVFSGPGQRQRKRLSPQQQDFLSPGGSQGGTFANVALVGTAFVCRTLICVCSRGLVRIQSSCCDLTCNL